MTNKDPFYKACIEACERLDKKKQFGTHAYNILDDCGLIDHILNGTVSLDDYTDSDLKSFRGLGNVTIDILRVAWSLYSKRPMQSAIEIDPVLLRGYSTGKDLIRWIKDHKLEDKQVYYAEHGRIGFIIDTHTFEGMEYHRTSDLNVIDGSYVEIRDNIS